MLRAAASFLPPRGAAARLYHWGRKGPTHHGNSYVDLPGRIRRRSVGLHRVAVALSIELHPFERVDWVHGRNLRTGDQLDSGHIITDVDVSPISHVRVVYDGDRSAPLLVAAHAQVGVIRPRSEPQQRANALRDQQRQRPMIALPAATPDVVPVVCSCGKDCTNAQGLSSHQRSSGHEGRWNA